MTIEQKDAVRADALLRSPQILLAHGSGGKLTNELIEGLFKPYLTGDRVLEDSAVLELAASRLAFTTDSFVVDPIFFPGGDIGKLAVNGTINDLSVTGAEPCALSIAFILEEGLPTSDLALVVQSVKRAAGRAGVKIVTGDTKVVRRGQCDKMYINTSGIGLVRSPDQISAAAAKAGDLVILSGTIAEHGLAVLSAREHLSFDNDILSDSCPLWSLVEGMLRASGKIRCLRDLTRGGLSAALNEIAKASRHGIRIRQDAIPVKDEVRGFCEVLGLDPLLVANEGKLVAFVDRSDADLLLDAMKANTNGRAAAIIGEVVPDHPGRVFMKTEIGGWRIVDMPAGEQLPRIC